MTTLRAAFVQTCPTGHTCFYFLSSISCLLSSLLSLQDKSTQPHETSLSHRISKLYTKFERVNQILEQSKKMSTWINSFSKNSLVQMSNDKSNEFEKEEERMSSVHVLQIINEDFEEFSDIKTVKSQEFNFDQNDPNSTQVSYQSDLDFSQIEDF